MAPAGELIGLTYRTGGSEVWVTQEKVNRPGGGLLKGVCCSLPLVSLLLHTLHYPLETMHG